MASMAQASTPSTPGSSDDTEVEEPVPSAKRALSSDDDAPAVARGVLPACDSVRERRVRAREADCVRRVERAEAQIAVLQHTIEAYGEIIARLEASVTRGAVAMGQLGALAESQLDELRTEQISRRACSTEEWWGAVPATARRGHGSETERVPGPPARDCVRAATRA